MMTTYGPASQLQGGGRRCRSGNEEAEEDGQDDEYAHVGGASGLFASEKVSDGPTL